MMLLIDPIAANVLHLHPNFKKTIPTTYDLFSMMIGLRVKLTGTQTQSIVTNAQTADPVFMALEHSDSFASKNVPNLWCLVQQIGRGTLVTLQLKSSYPANSNLPDVEKAMDVIPQRILSDVY